MATRNRVLLAMVVSMVLGYLPWYNFSAVLKLISQEFQLTAADTGFILAIFQAGYVLIVPLTGWLGDRIGLRRVVLWATLATGVFSTLFIFAARDLGSILVMRLLTGLSAGAIYVPGMALLSRWFPPSRRGHALGAYTAAVTAAYAGGYFVAAPLAAAYGWRTGILWTSLPAFIAALVVFLFVKEAPSERVEPSVAPASGTLSALDGNKGLEGKGPLPAPDGGNRGPAIITAGYMGHMWELFAFWGWLGPFMVAAATAAGVPSADVVPLAGAITAGIIMLGAPATWLWAIVADRRGRTWAIVVASLLSLSAELFLGFLYGQTLALVVLVAGWIGFWVIADSAIYKAGLTEMVMPTMRGTYLGLQSAVGFSMTIVSPLVFGAILQLYNGAVAPTEATVWGPSFLVLGLGALLAPAASLLLRRQSQATLMAAGKR